MAPNLTAQCNSRRTRGTQGDAGSRYRFGLGVYNIIYDLQGDPSVHIVINKVLTTYYIFLQEDLLLFSK